jgi:Transposase DDE domain
MRVLSGGVAHVAGVIEDDLMGRETDLYKSHISGLSDLAASVLACRSANTAEWMSVLPRKTGDEKSKERYISRILSNSLIKTHSVMNGFVPEIMEMAGDGGRTIILMLDQSKISDGFECLMVSMRTGERAIPIAWRVVKTRGPIGFDIQKPLIEEVASMVPAGAKIMLAADRFYGTSSLIGLCQSYGFSYRIRLKSTLILEHQGGEISTGDAANMKLTSLENATFQSTDVTTNIGILHEEGHKEPWIIAMDSTPSKYKVLDYSMRWGIECMFSDFKSRGFSITKTHLKHADRIERLILVLTLALIWAVSTGMKPKAHKSTTSKKNSTDH